MQWPICFGDLVDVGDLNNSVGVVTLWTKKEFILRHLKPEQYALVGQLYSRHEGFNALLRNCLANKNIRHILVVGVDLNKAGDALISFFECGVDENHSVKGVNDVIIDKEIPLTSLDNLRKHVKVYDYRSLKDFSKLSSIVNELENLGSYGEPEIFPITKQAIPDTYPSEKSGFVVRENYIGEAWLHILHNIMKFGFIKKSQYSDDQRELLNIVSVIEKEDPDNPKFYEFFKFTKEDLFNYYPQIISGDSIKGIEYSYGQRLRSEKDVDQIQIIIDILKKTLYTRRAIAVTWNLEKDISSEKPPCLILVHFLVQNKLLYMTAFFRSNDMFHAWPLNAFGLRKLQFTVAKEMDILPGSLTIISNSAHIYKQNWTATQDIIIQYNPKLKMLGDQRGNLIIRLVDGKIIVTHTGTGGKVLDSFTGKDAYYLYTELIKKKKVSELSHAIYLGTELQKAVIALEKGIPYVQDQQLQFI